MPVQPGSFSFAGVDMLETYGIRCVDYDFLLPPLRPRKVTVPERDGAYDFGALYYDERQLKLVCDVIKKVPMSRLDLRNLAYFLSKKGRIVLWDDPDRSYIGRLYAQTDLQYLGTIGHTFTLTFTCDPFAYGQTVREALAPRVQYEGTARTPTRLEITNYGTAAIRGIAITIRRRSEAI